VICCPAVEKAGGSLGSDLTGTGRGWAHRAVVAGPDRMSCRSRGSGSKTSPSRLDARDLAHLRPGTANCSDHQIGVGSPLARRRVSLRSTGTGCTHPHWRHRDPYPRLPLPELPTGSMTETRPRPHSHGRRNMRRMVVAFPFRQLL
jgi:hypothetical protein